MITPNDFRTGMLIELGGAIYQILSFQRVKIAQRRAFVRTRLKNLRSGAVQERNLNPEERLSEVELERRRGSYLYRTEEGFFFMDLESFEQYSLSGEVLGDAVRFLKEGQEVTLLFRDGRGFGIELPIFVELKVVETQPNFRGDTATGGNKPAEIETGCRVTVPLFINPGDVIKVDTRDGTYIERVSR